MLRCITAWSTGHDACVQAPSQTITYLSCHDDWTLWDKLVYTLSPAKKFHSRGDRVEIRHSEIKTKLVRLTNRSFYQMIHQKLGKV